MLANGYLDHSVQKAFMNKTSGCIEHQAKLAAILRDAHNKHKSLAVCWLDLANAYGSVHHSLINFSLAHYHAPPSFSGLVQSLYQGLSASVMTREWSTPPIPLKIGVYQGDPLSIVIFNTVINTLVDTLKTYKGQGYLLAPNHQINLLQYADDTCILANSPATCLFLLQKTDLCLNWSGMKAKVPKFHSLAFHSSTGVLVDPGLELSGQSIPFTGSRFLGMTVEVPQDKAGARKKLLQKLDSMLQAVDKIPLTRQQKLKLYKLAICPRLTWLLTVEEYSITWIEKEIEGRATRFLKKWAGLTRSANVHILYLPQRNGGLNLPSLTSIYKRLQVSKACQLLISANPTVRRMAEPPF